MSGLHTMSKPGAAVGRPAWQLSVVARLCGTVLLVSAGAQAQEARIYTCVDADGRRISADRPIPECLSREQKLLSRDGTTRAVVPPLTSREEQERKAALALEQSQAMAVQNEAVRRDKMLLVRYPDLRAWEAARQRALAPVQQRIDTATKRLADLGKEADALTAERRALGGKAMSADLKSRISINEGSTEAQRNILQNQSDERSRLMAQFDQEKVRLAAGLCRGGRGRGFCCFGGQAGGGGF